jgi:ADYC domain
MRGEAVRRLRWLAAIAVLAVICGATAPAAEAAPNRERAAATSWIPLDEILCWFGWCGSQIGNCGDWGCGGNSPVVDGAAIEEAAPPAKRPTNRARSVVTSWIPLDEILCWFGWCAPVSGGGGGCDDEFGCGENSPLIDGAEVHEQPSQSRSSDRSFHELNMNGLPNAAGFAVLGGRKGNISYVLEGAGAAIVARPKAANAPVLEGASLVDLALDLRDAADRRYVLRVAGTDTTEFWAGVRGSVRTYVLTHTNASGAAPRPLCTTGVNEAILFAGDRYDSRSKTVIATGRDASGWINIACAGTALAKLYLTRHTEASQLVATTRDERQAMLKMFTADVCGDGTSFTVHGQPLLWADAKGITTFASRPASVEAIWNASGAVCLDTPRRPELAPTIAARCSRPSCGAATSPAGRGHVISANPR